MQRIQSVIPFLDLSFQHRSIQPKLDKTLQQVMSGDCLSSEGVQQFENSFASICGAAVGVGLATSVDAFTLGLQACGVGRGDEVMAPATASTALLLAIARLGARPLLVDCDLRTGLMDLAAAERAINPHTQVLVASHLYGQMLPPGRLRDMAKTYDLKLLEDACHAPWAEREGLRSGSVGDAAVFSFEPTKLLSGFSQGAIVVFRDSSLAQDIWLEKTVQSTYQRWEDSALSTLDPLQVSVLRLKLPHLPTWNQMRLNLARYYDSLLAPLQPLGLTPLVNTCGSGHVYHRYGLRVDETQLNRLQLQMHLTAHNIQTEQPPSTPAYLNPQFEHWGYRLGHFPVVEQLHRELIFLPIYPGLLAMQAQRIAMGITAALQSGDRPSKSVAFA
jgi:dTDP-4-amino-4,6-dideoxygalactose transaminase